MDKRTQKRLIKAVISLLIVLLLTALQRYGIMQEATSSTQHVIQENTPGLYQVVRFDDGDTILVSMEGKEEKIRFIGVDTPETKDPRKPVQCFGKAASEFTKNTIGSSRVRLEADPTNSNRDRYQRLLRYVYLPDGTLVNKKIIEEGYGFALTSFPFTKMEEFRQAQKDAREHERGLWASCTIDTSNGYNQTASEQ